MPDAYNPCSLLQELCELVDLLVVKAGVSDREFQETLDQLKQKTRKLADLEKERWQKRQ